eukprot:7385509-Prymnesium_polylepis.1
MVLGAVAVVCVCRRCLRPKGYTRQQRRDGFDPEAGLDDVELGGDALRSNGRARSGVNINDDLDECGEAEVGGKAKKKKVKTVTKKKAKGGKAEKFTLLAADNTAVVD